MAAGPRPRFDPDETILARPLDVARDAPTLRGACDGLALGTDPRRFIGHDSDGADYPHLVEVDPRHYTIQSQIAAGGMGRILRARDHRLGRDVALKEALGDSPALAIRLEREARIIAGLQHPAIVNLLEAGVWPDGQPFYAMKLVAGRPLDVIVAEQRSPRARLALLPHVIAVADALAYAHAHHIVHRDLKPSNVLVGDFGETVVIDWGLAKDLSAGRRAPENETSVGTVIGTPAYMPPEQARGEAVDEHADVYAMGALLYHVLAGHPPFVDDAESSVLDRVLVGAARPLAHAAPGTPEDLVAIVEKAMHVRADARYPSARELAEDLKRFQTGQLVDAHRYTPWQLTRRFLARYKLPVAVAAVLLALMTAMAVFSVRRVLAARDAAEHALALTRAQRGAAEELVDYAFADLRRQITETGRLEPLFGIGTRVARYYERLGATVAGTGVESLRRRAGALELVSDVLDARGDRAGALRLCDEALALRAKVVLLAPVDHASWRDVARSHLCRARSLADGRDDEARADLARARAVLEPLVERGDDHAAGVLLGAVLVETADLALARGELDDAALPLARALDLLGARRARSADPELRANLARTHERLGRLAALRGHLDEALAQHRHALALCEELAGQDASPRWRARVSLAHAHIGEVLQAQGRLAEAQAELAQALTLAVRLAELDPSNNEWLGAVAARSSDLGTILLLRHDLAGAEAAFARAHQSIRRAAARDPASTRLERHVAVALTKLGQVKEQRGQLLAALADYREAVAILARVSAAEPGSSLALTQLAVGHSYVGDVAARLGDLELALRSYQAMVKGVKAAAERSPDDVALRKVLAVGLGLAAGVRERRGGPDERAVARQELAQAIAILRGLRAAGTLDAEGQHYLDTFEARATTARR